MSSWQLYQIGKNVLKLLLLKIQSIHAIQNLFENLS